MTTNPNVMAKDLAYEYIRSRIASLDVEIGEFLKEEDVAAATGISRTPVREAIRRLAAEGLLELVPKKGAYVPAMSDRDLRELMEARLTLEAFAIPSVIHQASDAVASLTELLDSQGVLLAQGELDFERFFDQDLRFHSVFVAAGHNRVISGVYDSLRARQLRMAVTAVKGGAEKRLRAAHMEHTRILDAVRSRDEDALRKSIYAHGRSTLEAAQVEPLSRHW